MSIICGRYMYKFKDICCYIVSIVGCYQILSLNIADTVMIQLGPKRAFVFDYMNSIRQVAHNQHDEYNKFQYVEAK